MKKNSKGAELSMEDFVRLVGAKRISDILNGELIRVTEEIKAIGEENKGGKV